MNPMNLDRSRQMDYLKMQSKLSDPNTPDWEKKKAKEALYAIKSQQQFPSIQKLRDRMEVAIRNGDNALAEKISEQAKRIDRDWQ